MAAPAPAPGFSLVTWNVNGIRARGERLRPVLERLGAEIICLQETKITRDLLNEPTAIVEGFNSYFSSSRGRSGYSGVATFCKDSAVPFAAEEGLSGLLTNHDGAVGSYGDLEGFSAAELRLLDSEGRALITQHRIRTYEEKEETLTVINVYCPRADPEKAERGLYKLRFYQLLQARALALLQAGGNVIVLGDMNTEHRPIDHCQPGDLDVFDKHPDRRWMNGFLCSPDLSPVGIGQDSYNKPRPGGEGKGGSGPFVDVFRLFHPTEREAYTCWRARTGARQTNYGARIDYIFANNSLADGELQDCLLMPEIEGSDHCPVKAFLKGHCIPATKCPPLCTKYMLEFAGHQLKLSRFLVNVQREKQSWSKSQDSTETGLCFQPQANPPKTVKPDQKQTRKCLTKGKAKRGKSDSRLSGNLLRFFKPSDTHPASGFEKCEVFNHTPSSTSDHRVNHNDGTKQDEQVKGHQSKPPAAFWKSFLKGRPAPPTCAGHQEPCVLRTVRKAGPNCGRQFYVCPRPEGSAANPGARCNFFLWVNTKN